MVMVQAVRQKSVGSQGQVAVFQTPSPFGRGWGEGLASSEQPHTLFLFSLRFAPSPWPSPKGRGEQSAADSFLAHRSARLPLAFCKWAKLITLCPYRSMLLLPRPALTEVS